jgi:uncharacterized delta-60 repeat protein
MNKQRALFSDSRFTRGFACVVAAVLVVTLTIHRVEAADGDLDVSFGNGGIVITDLGSTEFAQCVAIQKDGRIVVGLNYSPNVGAGDFSLMRYNADGSVDSSFGFGGVVQTNFLGLGGNVLSVKVDAQGRILAAGYIVTSSESGPPTDLAIARYNANGSLDTSFGVQGKVTRSNTSNHEWIRGLAIQKDGKIVVAATSVNPSYYWDFAVFRLNSNGSPDLTFAGGSIVLTDFYGNNDIAASVVIQADGRIVVGGTAEVDYNTSDFALARYNANGTIDTTFGIHGRVTTRFSGDEDTCSDILLRPMPFGGEQIIATGTIGITYPISHSGDFGMVCYQSDGSLNQAFGAGGIVVTDFSGEYDVARCAVRQADGKIVVAGQSYVISATTGTINNGIYFALARYTLNGTLDTAFGQGGKVITPMGYHIEGLALTPQGGIIAAGAAWATQDILLAKYLP